MCIRDRFYTNLHKTYLVNKNMMGTSLNYFTSFWTIKFSWRKLNYTVMRQTVLENFLYVCAWHTIKATFKVKSIISSFLLRFIISLVNLNLIRIRHNIWYIFFANKVYLSKVSYSSTSSKVWYSPILVTNKPKSKLSCRCC